MIEIADRVVHKIRQKLATRTFRKVRHTHPLNLSESDDVVVVSQVHHQAIDMAILALKSFLLKLGRGRLEIINDGSLTAEDIRQLNLHFPGIVIVEINSVPLGRCPSGGTWERLIHILNLSKDAYVIQVDSDTLTIGPVDEIYSAIEANRAFLVGEPSWQEPIPVEYMSSYADKVDSKHIQVLSERVLSSVTSIPLKKYTRGCSAFTGFPKGGVTFSNLENFSVEMEQVLGHDKWREWGTEQFSSNVMLSLCPDVLVLPWPKYLNFGFPFINGHFDTVKSYLGQTSVLHFIGTNRYSRGVYTSLANKLIKELR